MRVGIGRGMALATGVQDKALICTRQGLILYRAKPYREGVYNSAEVMPAFPGGNDGLSSYVNEHLQYPQRAIDDNTAGTVKVSFVVDEKGKVINAHLMGNEKVGNGLDEEALRVVNTMPAWKPGKVKGKNVKTRLELPISFQLEA